MEEEEEEVVEEEKEEEGCFVVVGVAKLDLVVAPVVTGQGAASVPQRLCACLTFRFPWRPWRGGWRPPRTRLWP